MTEMFGNLNTRRALFNFRPNPGLKPETSKTKEVGATLAFDDLVAGGEQPAGERSPTLPRMLTT